MPTIVIIISALPLLAGLLYSAAKESPRGMLITKPFLSALFIATALVGSHSNPHYFGLVLAGLVLCMAGDIFLIFFSSQRLFLAGLVSFLAGHILYALDFCIVASPGILTAASAVIFPAVGVVVFRWLKPHLGRMLIPVIAYLSIITVMVIGAASLAGNGHLPVPGRILAFSGAMLFYISDIFVARHRFVKKETINRLIGLPLYYLGQFMIAYSTILI
jgi:uncharacterized membrane protein YhhN